MRAFLVVVAGLSCLVGSAGLWVCQKAGWTSDGPGLLCPLIIMVAGYGVAALCAWIAVTSGPPPIN